MTARLDRRLAPARLLSRPSPTARLDRRLAPAKPARTTARRHAALAGALAALAGLLPAAAIAQEPGTEVGGSVPSYLELSIDAPAALAGFPSATGASEAAIAATITATDAPIELSIADGDTDAAARRGHLVAGARMLGDPLQATAGGAPFQPLDQPLGPLLMRWSDVLAGQRTVIRLRQRATAAALRAGPYAKTVLITASTQTP